MADERYGLRCPVCCNCIYVGKALGGGIYVNGSYEDRLTVIHQWMWQHLNECCGEYRFGRGNEVLFEVIHEGHEDAMKHGHWNRYYVEDGVLKERAE